MGVQQSPRGLNLEILDTRASIALQWGSKLKIDMFMYVFMLSCLASEEGVATNFSQIRTKTKPKLTNWLMGPEVLLRNIGNT